VKELRKEKRNKNGRKKKQTVLYLNGGGGRDSRRIKRVVITFSNLPTYTITTNS
jgi:hypothetical protein